AFIFGGISLLISMIWGDLGSAARVIISYGSGLCAFITAYVFTRDERYANLSFPFYLISALLMPFGMFVFLHEYVGGNDLQMAIISVFGILAVQFAVPFLKDKKTSLLFFAYFFFYLSLGALLDRVHVPRDIAGLGMGLSIIAFAFYFDKTVHRPICAFWYFIGIGTYLASISNMMFNLDMSGNLIGVIMGLSVLSLGWYFKEAKHNIIAPTLFILGSLGFLYSLFDAVEGKPFVDLSFLAVAVLMMIISVRAQSRILLVMSTLAIISFLGYFTGEYFADVTGWPIALIIFGFFLISISRYALKLGKKISAT
ncbi:MAG TPA: hypothetical protein PLF01_03855, partial [Alphaproteobacteria bacterium]|nr:hypothetical protein [Alphaproteobacteria bacterium]